MVEGRCECRQRAEVDVGGHGMTTGVTERAMSTEKNVSSEVALPMRSIGVYEEAAQIVGSGLAGRSAEALVGVPRRTFYELSEARLHQR